MGECHAHLERRFQRKALAETFEAEVVDEIPKLKSDSTCLAAYKKIQSGKKALLPSQLMYKHWPTPDSLLEP